MALSSRRYHSKKICYRSVDPFNPRLWIDGMDGGLGRKDTSFGNSIRKQFRGATQRSGGKHSSLGLLRSLPLTGLI